MFMEKFDLVMKMFWQPNGIYDSEDILIGRPHYGFLNLKLN